MSNDFKKHAKSIADSSGFPLQIRVSNIVNSIQGWQILLEEHPWLSEETNLSGFIDLIIENYQQYGETKTDKFYVMLVECKRVRQTSWVFLVPEINKMKFTRARIWFSNSSDRAWNHFYWANCQVEPNSYESQFCAIPGMEHGRRNLLERTASELIEATEAFARQEQELYKRYPSPRPQFQRIYIPIIVTTAELIVSRFEPGRISLKDGSLPDDAIFEEVPSVRFRKSLTGKLPSGQDSVKKVHDDTQRTIFIVNAGKFEEFLNNFYIQGI
jgi:hypothetical protein